MVCLVGDHGLIGAFVHNFDFVGRTVHILQRKLGGDVYFDDNIL